MSMRSFKTNVYICVLCMSLLLLAVVIGTEHVLFVIEVILYFSKHNVHVTTFYTLSAEEFQRESYPPYKKALSV